MATTIHAISMPKWGMEMVEGVVVEWRFATGDLVNAGDGLVEIETSKIVNTLDSHESGVLRRILGNPGDTLPCGALIGVLADSSVSEADIDAFIAKSAGAATAGPTPANEPPAAKTAGAMPAISSSDITGNTTAPSSREAAPNDGTATASVIARRIAKQYEVNLRNLRGTGRHGRISKHDVEDAIRAAGGTVAERPASAPRPKRPPTDDSDVSATSLARRLAKKWGISLHDCRATGIHGRVCKSDVEAARARAQPVSTAAQSPGVDRGYATVAAAQKVIEKPLSGIRRTIASRLQASKQTAPHYRVSVDVTLDALLAVRSQINEQLQTAKVSINDFLIKACAMALVRVPEINIQFDGTIVRQFSDADIAVAVNVDKGLITPIIRAANTLGLVEISNRMRDLSARARTGTLKPEEFQGGTFSISNLGMFGVRQFDAIINPPQGSILAAGMAEQRPIVTDGTITIATVMSLSLSSDHRVIDGALAARFLTVLTGYLRQPATMLF